MLLQRLLPLLTSPLLTFASTASSIADSCYGSTLPSVSPSTDHRPVPWGSPSVHFSSLNGTLTTCCNSLDDVRTALDDIDDQLLNLLNQRYGNPVHSLFFSGPPSSLLDPCHFTQPYFH